MFEVDHLPRRHGSGNVWPQWVSMCPAKSCSYRSIFERQAFEDELRNAGFKKVWPSIGKRVEARSEDDVLIEAIRERRLDKILDKARPHRRPAAEAHQLSLGKSSVERLRYLNAVRPSKIPRKPVVEHMRRRTVGMKRPSNRGHHRRTTRTLKRTG